MSKKRFIFPILFATFVVYAMKLPTEIIVLFLCFAQEIDQFHPNSDILCSLFSLRDQFAFSWENARRISIDSRQENSLKKNHEMKKGDEGKGSFSLFLLSYPTFFISADVLLSLSYIVLRCALFLLLLLLLSLSFSLSLSLSLLSHWVDIKGLLPFAKV